MEEYNFTYKSNLKINKKQKVKRSFYMTLVIVYKT